MEERYLTYAEAAEMLGLNVNTVYAMVSTKCIPHVRLGPRLVRFSRTALAAWIEARTVEPDGERKPPQ